MSFILSCFHLRRARTSGTCPTHGHMLSKLGVHTALEAVTLAPREQAP